MEVRLTNGFLKQKQLMAVNKMIPYQWQALNDAVEGSVPSGAMQNLRHAAKKEKAAPQGRIFQDSDLAKYLEACAWAEEVNRSSARRKNVQECIRLLKKAQQDDGYLNNYFILDEQRPRFANLQDEHELYCAGHLLEAAVAWYQTTGQVEFLQIMERYIDLIIRVFGYEPGKLAGYPGHEEIELALGKAYEITKQGKYLKLMNYFLTQRGTAPHIFAAQYEQRNGKKPPEDEDYHYYQAHRKVVEQEEAVGHSVRAVYLYTAMAMASRINGDARMFSACKKLWESITRRRMYITGGIGSCSIGETFTSDYDLPNDLAYSESCASIGLIFFAREMLRCDPKGEYADVMEKALYNCVLAGTSQEGDAFFYVNPLEVVPQVAQTNPTLRHVKTQRQGWFGCACCPPNIARLLSSLQNYVYIRREDGLYCGLYTASTATIQTETGVYTLHQRTSYPWHGRITFEVEGDSVTEEMLALRIPAWCEEFELVVNGELLRPTVVDGYVKLRRRMCSGDRIVLELIMKPKFMQANPTVWADAGKVALTRGPLVYCAEECDNGADLHRLLVNTRGRLNAVWEKDLLGGVMRITAQGLRESGLEEAGLYLDAALQAETEKCTLRFVPYYAWGNREKGEMRVWLRRMG